MAIEKKEKMMAMEKKNREGMFSKLPDDVITHILSFLDTPIAAKISILCKRFTPLWLSLPSLLLPHYSPPHPYSYRDNLVEFLVMVSDLIGAISERHNSSLHKLRITFQHGVISDEERGMAFRKLMPLVFDKCSGHLELSFNREFYPSLDPFLSSAPKSLTSLKFTGANFQSLDHLISICPLLRHLSLVRCVIWMSDIRISATQLTTLVFSKCENRIERKNDVICPYSSVVARIHIEAKNLQTFSYTMVPDYPSAYDIVSTDCLKILTLEGNFTTSWLEATVSRLLALESLSIHHPYSPSRQPLRISSQSLKRLESIYYSNVTIDSPMLTSLMLEKCDLFSISSSCSSHGLGSITSLVLRESDDIPKWLELHLAKCKLLRQLKLISCALTGNITISHKRLERLDIWECSGMEEVYIDTPRLRSFTHKGEPLAFKRFNHSASLQVTLHIENSAKETPFYFSELRPLLEPYKSCKVLTLSSPVIEGSITQDCDELLLAEVLILRVGPTKSYKVLVESLLWMCCHLKLIKIILDSEVKSIEFKYNEASLLKDRHSKCLKSRCITRCWTQGLESVMLTNISSEQLKLRQFFKNCKMFEVNIRMN